MGIDAQMFIKVREKSYRLASLLGYDKFFIRKEVGRHCLSLITEYTQDGPSIFPKKGETFIEVHMWSRYWGEGYARGDLPFIMSVAAVLEFFFPGAEVWYGGDSSGVQAERFGPLERGKFWRAFCKDENSYSAGWGKGKGEVDCNFCKRPMMCGTWFGGGSEATGWYCPGCGERAYLEGDACKHFDTEEDMSKYVAALRADPASVKKPKLIEG